MANTTASGEVLGCGHESSSTTVGNDIETPNVNLWTPPDLQVMSGWFSGNSLQESIRPTVVPVGTGPDDIRSVEASLVERPGFGQTRYQAGSTSV